MRPQILIALIACTTALPSMITAMPPNPMDPSSISGAATSGNANVRANANLHPVDDRGDGDFEGDTMSEEAVAYRRRVSRARAGAGAGIPSGHSRAIFNAAFRPSPEDVPQQQQQQRGRDGDRVATATNTSEEDRLVDELLNSFLTVGRAIEGEDEAPATAAAQPRVTVEQQQQQQPRRSSQQVRGDARLQHDAARLPPRPQAPSSPPAAAHAQVPVVDPSAAALHLRTMLHRHHDVTARERITRALHIAPYPSSYFHKTSGTHSLTKLAKSTSPPSAVDMTVTHHYATPRRVTLKWKLRDPDAVMHARSAEALLLVGYEGAHSRAPMDEWRAPSLMDDIVFEIPEAYVDAYSKRKLVITLTLAYRVHGTSERKILGAMTLRRAGMIGSGFELFPEPHPAAIEQKLAVEREKYAKSLQTNFYHAFPTGPGMSSIGEDEEEPAGGVPDAMSIETIRQGMYRELANEVEGKVYRQMITEKYGKGYFDVQGGHEVMSKTSFAPDDENARKNKGAIVRVNQHAHAPRRVTIHALPRSSDLIASANRDNAPLTMRYTIELVRPRAAASVISGQPLIQRYNRAVASLDDTVTLTLQGLAEDATPADIESAYLRVTTTLEITHPSNEPDVPRSPIIKPLGTATFPYKHFRVQRDPTSEEMESRVREELKAMLQKGAISQEMLVYAGQQRLVEGHVYERERPETSRSTL